ncbi:MAG: hypothetical protein AAF938_00495 [Myxococcota bacterium]
MKAPLVLPGTLVIVLSACGSSAAPSSLEHAEADEAEAQEAEPDRSEASPSEFASERIAAGVPDDAWLQTVLAPALQDDGTAALAALMSSNGLWLSWTVNDPHGVRPACDASAIAGAYEEANGAIAQVDANAVFRCAAGRCLACQGSDWASCANAPLIEFASVSPPRIRGIARAYLQSEEVRSQASTPTRVEDLPPIAARMANPCGVRERSRLAGNTGDRIAVANGAEVSAQCGINARTTLDEAWDAAWPPVCTANKCSADIDGGAMAILFENDRPVAVVQGESECAGCGVEVPAALHALVDNPGGCSPTSASTTCLPNCAWRTSSCPSEARDCTPETQCATGIIDAAFCDPSCCGERP